MIEIELCTVNYRLSEKQEEFIIRFFQDNHCTIEIWDSDCDGVPAQTLSLDDLEFNTDNECKKFMLETHYGSYNNIFFRLFKYEDNWEFLNKFSFERSIHQDLCKIKYYLD